MTCKCPKGWCYYRSDCREHPEPIVQTVDRTAEVKPPSPARRERGFIMLGEPRAQRLHRDSKAAAVGYLDRAINQIESGNTTGSKRVQGIRLALLVARRNELMEV